MLARAVWVLWCHPTQLGQFCPKERVICDVVIEPSCAPLSQPAGYAVLYPVFDLYVRFWGESSAEMTLCVVQQRLASRNVFAGAQACLR